MKILSVIGDPISHSRSPIMHNYVIKKLNLNAIYTRYNLKDKNFLRDVFFDLKLFGANITLPFKEEALKIADIKDKMALNAGNANILICKNNTIYAYNSDIYGFLMSIKEFNNIRSVLILGAGGTAKTIYHALKCKNINISIANRTKDKMKYFKDCFTSLYDDLEIKEYDLIINTTSVGLNDDSLMCSEKKLDDLFKKARYAYDVIYTKDTKFVKLAKKNNLFVKNGLDMFLWQGVLSFELFFDIKNQKNTIARYMKEALNLV